MNIFRARHDNVPESPVRTLYGRKGNLLLLPLDVCILQTVNGNEEFRPSPETARLIAAPIQDEKDGRIGLIAKYDWPSLLGSNGNGTVANPVVTVQLAPSANVKGVEDLRVLACRVELGDAVVCVEGGAEGVVVRDMGWCAYPDLTHRVKAYRVEFRQHISNRAHGSAVRLKSGGDLVGMLIATHNQGDGADSSGGVCRALVYPA
jgi:hypothetical protein